MVSIRPRQVILSVGQVIEHACSFSSFQFAQLTRKQKPHLPTGQVDLNVFLCHVCRWFHGFNSHLDSQ